MKTEYKLSIIVPAYNAEKIIGDCLTKIIQETKNIVSEIIVVDDCSTDNTLRILGKFNEIKVVSLKKNMGVGYARNQGALEAQYQMLCFIDSDIIIENNSIYNLLERFYKSTDVGSVSGTQTLNNLNRESWTSNFVCLKSCYGTDTIQQEIDFSTICSEFCLISRDIFDKVGKWKSVSRAGGEEFDFGFKIKKLNKKNIKLKNAGYSGYWCNIFQRSKNIIERTEKYIPIFFKKKKFDSKGSFATGGQVFSSLLTLLIILTLLFNLFFKVPFFSVILAVLIILQFVVEGKFLIFAFKKHNIKMLLFSLLGIQIINLSIFFGFFLFIFKNSVGLPFKNKSKTKT